MSSIDRKFLSLSDSDRQVLIYLTNLSPTREALPEGGGRICWSEHRYRAITLLDLMKLLDVSGLMKVFAKSERLRLLREHIELQGDPSEMLRNLPDQNRTELSAVLMEIGFACYHADLSYSNKNIFDAIEGIRDGHVKLGDLNARIAEVQRRIRDELESRVFLAPDPSHVQFYKEPTAGWEEAIERFPSSQRDIEESSKCIALDRPTASVFHLMRALGPGFKAIAKALGTSEYEPGWGAYLAAFHGAYTKKFAAKTAHDEEWLQFYSGLEVQLRLIAVAWRNPVMHAVEETYQPEEAIEIYGLVRAFMRRLAKKLPAPSEQFEKGEG